MPGAADQPPPGRNNVQLRALDEVWDYVVGFLDDEIGHFLPGAVDRYPQSFRWHLLADSQSGQELRGAHRLRSQFVRANIVGSERYVQSLPGTDRYRIAPGNTGYTNLAIAGDWTDTGFNAGCVEAATMSGMLAANAVIGSDDTDRIVGHRDP